MRQVGSAWDRAPASVNRWDTGVRCLIAENLSRSEPTEKQFITQRMKTSKIVQQKQKPLYSSSRRGFPPFLYESLDIAAGNSRTNAWQNKTNFTRVPGGDFQCLNLLEIASWEPGRPRTSRLWSRNRDHMFLSMYFVIVMFASQSGGASHRHPDKVCKHNKVSKNSSRRTRVSKKKLQSYLGLIKRELQTFQGSQIRSATKNAIVPGCQKENCKRTLVSDSCRRSSVPKQGLQTYQGFKKRAANVPGFQKKNW